jgi:hypothetical protein
MQVEMAETRDTGELQQRTYDALVAQTREVLSTSKERQEHADRTVAKALRTIRRALVESRRGY